MILKVVIKMGKKVKTRLKSVVEIKRDLLDLEDFYLHPFLHSLKIY